MPILQKIIIAAALLIVTAFVMVAAINVSPGKLHEKCNREWEEKSSGYTSNDKTNMTACATDTERRFSFFLPSTLFNNYIT